MNPVTIGFRCRHTASPLSAGRSQLLLMLCLVNSQFTQRLFEVFQIDCEVTGGELESLCE